MPDQLSSATILGGNLDARAIEGLSVTKSAFWAWGSKTLGVTLRNVRVGFLEAVGVLLDGVEARWAETRQPLLQ